MWGWAEVNQAQPRGERSYKVALLHISLAEINQPLPQDDASIARARAAQRRDRIQAAHDMGIDPELISLFEDYWSHLERGDAEWDKLVDTLRTT